MKARTIQTIRKNSRVKTTIYISLEDPELKFKHFADKLTSD